MGAQNFIGETPTPKRFDFGRLKNGREKETKRHYLPFSGSNNVNTAPEQRQLMLLQKYNFIEKSKTTTL